MSNTVPLNSAQDDTETKVCEFARAIEKYNTSSIYTQFEQVLSTMVVLLQVFSLINLIQNYHYDGALPLICTLFLTYLATDFLNGLVHMIIDNNTHYTSIVGPFIATFHLYHYNPSYTKKNPIKLYYTESGHKFWLVVYLIFLVYLQQVHVLEANFNLGLVLFGILSSVAELSHYWCHSAKTNAFISFLQKYRILLSLKHHRHHHIKDNRNYAFLNGVSDPLLNIIAQAFCKGYKNRSDRHVALYNAKNSKQT